jgi:hypothetical protein
LSTYEIENWTGIRNFLENLFDNFKENEEIKALELLLNKAEQKLKELQE